MNLDNYNNSKKLEEMDTMMKKIIFKDQLT